MKTKFALIALFALAVTSSGAFGTEQPETPRAVFISEFIRELAAIENIRDSVAAELKQDDDSAKLSTGIYFSTRMRTELQAQIKMLKDMHFNPPFDNLASSLTQLYAQEIEIHQSLINVLSAVASGPKPGMDYGKLAAQLPQLRAALDDTDQTLMKNITPLSCYLLIDSKTDSKNHSNHLVITRAERIKLIGDLTSRFGQKLELKNPNLRVSSAQIVSDFLRSDLRSSDDPWE